MDINEWKKLELETEEKISTQRVKKSGKSG